MGASEEAYKFWLSPDGKMVKFDPRDEHVKIALKLGYAGRGKGDILDNAAKDGWIRGADTRDGKLLLDIQEIRDSKTLSRIEDLVYRTLNEHSKIELTLDVFGPRRYTQTITGADLAGGESVRDILSREWVRRGISPPSYETEITWGKRADAVLKDYETVIGKINRGATDTDGNLIQRIYGIGKRTEALLSSTEAKSPLNKKLAESISSLAAKSEIAGQNIMRALSYPEQFSAREPEIWEHFTKSKTPPNEWARRIGHLAKEGDFSYLLFRYPERSIGAVDASNNEWHYKLKNADALRKVAERLDITNFRPESIDKVLKFGEEHPAVRKIIETIPPTGKVRPGFRGYEPAGKPLPRTEVRAPRPELKSEPKPVEVRPVEVRPVPRPRPVHRFAGFLGVQDPEVDEHYRNAMKALFGDSTSSNPDTSSAANLKAIRIQNTYKSYSEGKLSKDEALKVFAEYEKTSPWVWAGLGFVAVGAIIYFFVSKRK